MRVFSFNTNNPYTLHGQRIGGVVLDDNAIVFYDQDRMVDGYLPPEFYSQWTPRERIYAGYMNSYWYYWASHGVLSYEDYRHWVKLAQQEALKAPSNYEA